MIYYLCVKTHQKTGLKYLCQTKQNNPHKYRGSGVNWLKHLKEHGHEHTTEILHECHTKEELKKYGLHYSSLWNVVDSIEWANLKPEDGGGGWYLFGDKNPQKRKAVREKTSAGMKKYLDDNPEKLQAWIKWRNDFWTPERIKELNTGGRGTVSVTDSDGNSKRISREYYATMARPTDMTKWEYVPVAAKESKRRKNLKISP